jgi:nicotinate-nucleotide pyrophosphorylase (carboxylating)
LISAAQEEQEIQSIIKNALREDIGSGDHSTLACIPANVRGKAALLVKESGYISGLEFARKVFETLSKDIEFESLQEDGAFAEKGSIAFIVEGPSHVLLQAERLVLNAIQRMSGITTKTRAYVAQLAGTKTKLLDTRKTTPGIRALEKWAVRLGGGVNHRFALYDAIMLKDNHIDFCGGMDQAIKATKDYLQEQKLDLPVIVEARDFDEIQLILKHTGITRILIDNFSIEETKKAVALIGDHCQTESSGMINLKTIRDYALCGVDYVSCGAITHSVQNLDLSLKAINE